MLMPTKNRIAIYEYLFAEGVIVAKKDVHLAKHPDVKSVPNLHVIKAMQSLKSRGHVKEQFAWRHYYWYLTNEGIEYLREQLHLPDTIVPATLKRQAPTGPRSAVPQRPDRGGKLEDAPDRDAYRRDDKAADAGLGAGQMQFQSGFGSGFGRGKPM